MHALLELALRHLAVRHEKALAGQELLELLRRLIREGRVERVGRGAATRYRRR